VNTDPGEASHVARRKARAEAAAWIVRLHAAGRTQALEAAFRRWRAADPENARQFDRVTEVWDAAPSLPLGAGVPPTHLRPHSSVGPWLKAAMVVLVCGVLAYAAGQFPLADKFRTQVGEQRVVRLEDGSRIALNSRTTVAARFTSSRRRVTLENGEAYFEVAHDANRPFIVVAAGHVVTALGTTFLVRQDGENHTAVTLVEGKVTVSIDSQSPNSGEHARPAGASAGAASPARESSVTLSPGERLVLMRDALPKLDSPQIDALLAWRRGEVVLDKTPLAEAVAEMNRYEAKPVVVAAAAGEQLRISGIYRIGDNRGFAATIARLYGLQLVENEREIRLLGATPDAVSRP
jgi:transmembrane sensor